MARGTNLEHTRAYNRRAVLEAIRVRGAVSRTEISQATSLTLQAVSNIVSDLVAEGLVLDRGRRTTRRGQPPVEYSLNPSGAFSIGIGLERDHLAGVLMNLSGETLKSVRRELTTHQPTDAIEQARDITKHLLSTLSHEQRSKFLGVGLALPGVIDESQGRVIKMVSLPRWEGFPITSSMSERLHLPVHVANDAVMAALGERWYGQGRAFKTFFFVLLSLGLGSSLILDGTPYGGVWGITGRLGHIPIEPGGRFCPACGESGCLSLYTSIDALVEELAQHGEKEASVDDLESLYENQDPVLIAWLDKAAKRMVRGLVTLENLLDPEAIIFGGRLPEPLLEHLLTGIREQYARRRVLFKGHQTQLVRSQVDEGVVVLGAATLPIYLAFAPDYNLLLKRTSV